MEALGILKFWRNTVVGADISSEVDDERNSACGTDEDQTDDDDSFFDLIIKSPDGAAENRGDDLKKDSRFIESPRDIFRTKSSHKLQTPVIVLRSAAKFKVFMLGFKKCEWSNRVSFKNKPAETPVSGRDSSLRSKMLKDSWDYKACSDVVSSEKLVPKYLKLIKPFYVKASSRTKLKDSATTSSSPSTAPVNMSPRKFVDVSRVGSFKIMTKSMVKSRSGSASDGIAPPSIRRRDDSLLEQHDGIQGAITHCKKSYSTSTYQEFSRLCRVSSDTSHEKLMINSCEGLERRSI